MAGETTAKAGRALLVRAMRARTGSLVAAVLIGLAWTAAKVVVPTLTEHAIDDAVLAGHGSVLTWGLAILAMGVIAAICSGTRRWYASKLAMGIETDLRAELFEHLVGLDPAFFDHASTGQLMSRASSDIQQIQGLFIMVPLTICNLATVVAVTGVLLATEPRLALLALGALPAMTVIAIRFSRVLFPVSVDVQQELAGLATIVEETVTGIRAVKGFGAESRQAEQLRASGSRVFASSIRLGRIRAFYAPLLDLVPSIGLAAVLWFGGSMVISHTISLGTLIAFNAYVLMLVWPLRMTGWVVAQAQRALASAARLDELLRTEAHLLDPAAPRDLPVLAAGGAAGAVVFDHVTFAYAADGRPPVLADLSFTLAPGEKVALVGPTGSGKSTVARLLARSYDVSSGSIALDGVELRDLRRHDLRTAVATVPEETFLFSTSVRDNIAFAAPPALRGDAAALDAAVERALALAGATDFVAALPEGDQTVLGERGFSLSGGQRQRLALARAIVADPRLLVLDDATSAVDPSKEHEIREALATVMQGRTTLVIAHRPATIALADRVLLLDTDESGHRARIVAEGTHASLLASEPRYREVLARAGAADALAAEAIAVGS